MQENFPTDNTINRMVTSGARGNWLQVRNIAGMRGLVNNPGEIIRVRSSPRTARGYRWRSKPSPRTVPAGASPTRRSARRTRAT